MGVRNRVFALGGIVIALALVLLIWATTLTFASQRGAASGEPSLDRPTPAEAPATREINLLTAAEQAETFADDVYGGLETTQELIGKTQERNQAIAHGRTTASSKLQGLAKRARQAHQNEGESLSKVDLRVLRHISE
jgi:hypothetical protein